jgi:cell division protein FtsI (penicillin-binding protein 3)
MTPAGGPPRAPGRARPSGRPPARTRPAARPPRPVRPRSGPAARRPHPRRVASVHRHNPRRRLVGLLLVVVLAFGAVGYRLVHLQVLTDERYEAYGAEQRIRSVVLPADRGSIFDRNGHDLAVSIPQRTIWADPRLVEDHIGAAAALAPLVDEDATTLEARLGGDSHFAYVARRVPDAVARQVEALDLPGVFFLDEPKRFAPSGDLGRSMLGQVGVDNEGLSGLELQYDDILTGTPGELVVEKDRDGRTIPTGEHQLVPALRGEDLVLTIDRSLQHETERALAEQIVAKGAKGGIAIVSRPATGEILSMANFTTDPDTGAPVATGNNMALTTVFEPGSVNKVISVAAALEERLVSPETVLEVPDSMWVADHEFSDHDPHPTEGWSVTRILTESSNIGTIKLAQMLGTDRVDSYLRRFGFGAPTGLGFPNEAAGIMLDPGDWSGTSMGSIPIGQGIAVTALQMLAAYNVLANDGTYVPPRLVLDTVDAAGKRHPAPTAEPRPVVSPRTAEQMRDMLVNVVAEGTGSRGGVTGYTVAGKTGTARKPQPTGGYEDANGNYAYVATFTGFVPAERPELSIIVAIDEPAFDIYGGSVAAPVFADLAQYGLRLFKVPPPSLERPPSPDTAAADAGVESVTAPPEGPVRAAPAAEPEQASEAAASDATVDTPPGG